MKSAPKGIFLFSSFRASLDKQILSVEFLNQPVLQAQLFEWVNQAASSLGKLAELRKRDSQMTLQENIDKQVAKMMARH